MVLFVRARLILLLGCNRRWRSGVVVDLHVVFLTATKVLRAREVTSWPSATSFISLTHGARLVIVEHQEGLPEAAGKPFARDLIRDLEKQKEDVITNKNN